MSGDNILEHIPKNRFISTHGLSVITGRKKESLHQELVKLRGRGLVEQMRENSPKRPGRTRYVITKNGTWWRLRPAQREQENQEQGKEPSYEDVINQVKDFIDLELMEAQKRIFRRLEKM